MNMAGERFHDIIDTNSPAETLAEIKNILLLIDPSPDPWPIEYIYTDIIRLFIVSAICMKKGTDEE